MADNHKHDDSINDVVQASEIRLQNEDDLMRNDAAQTSAEDSDYIPSDPDLGTESSSSDAALDNSSESRRSEYRTEELREASDYFVQTQLSRLDELIMKYNALEDGDTIDLKTGRIIENHGHLAALPVQTNILSPDAESSSESEVEASVNNSSDSIPWASRDTLTHVIDLFQTVCSGPTSLLNDIVKELHGTPC